MASRTTYLGLYCGCGADGVDAAVVAVSRRGQRLLATQLSGGHYPLDDGLRRKIHDAAGITLARPAPGMLAALCAPLAEAFAKAAAAEIAKSKEGGLAGIGIAGLRLTLDSPGGPAAIELGDPGLVARQTALPVAAEFPPAVCPAWPDWCLFAHAKWSRVLVHLGAIATVSFLPAAAHATDAICFDAGPGTIVLDALARRLLSKPFDADGAAAAGGKTSPELLHELLAQPFFRAPAARTAIPAHWGESFVQRLLLLAEKHRCEKPADLLATCTEWTARAIAAALAGLTERPHEVILSGGGAYNIHLAARIRTLMSPASTFSVEKFGIGLRARHAVGAALLASARINEICLPLPGDKEGIAGGLWLP